MVTKADEISMEVPGIVGSIEEHAVQAGFAPKVIPVAAISRTPAQVKSGTGVMDLIEYILRRNADWKLPEVVFTEVPSARNFARIRG